MAYTYSTLLQDVIDNMEEDSDEFLSALPSIVLRAQDYLQRRCDSAQINTFVSAIASAGEPLLTLPSNLLVLKSAMVSTSVGTGPLIQQTNEYLRTYWPVMTSTGNPKYFANLSNQIISIAPTPEADSGIVLEYVARVTTMTSAAPTNWFGDNAENALFASCMMYANMWTKNSGASQLWKTVADDEIQALNNEARRTRQSDSSDRQNGTPENNLLGKV